MASSHPVITSYFHSSNSASWLSTAFLLTSTAFQPLLGSLSDTIGRKTPYIFTMLVFALATLWCALAQSMVSFIAARAVCGLGAGGVMILGSIIVSDLVPIEHRGAYQSYINAVYGVGSTLGAALGGFMADYLGWRWEFGIQVPPLLLCVGLTIFTIPHDLGLTSGTQKATFLQAMRTFDFQGSLLLTSAITFLILGLNLGGNVLPWTHPFVLASLAIFCIAFPLFLRAETNAVRPIMPLYLIRRSPHANMIFSNALAAFMMNAIIFNMPLFFQAVLLTSATTSGLCLMIITVVSSTAGTATGFLVSWTRRLKWPMSLGTYGFFLGTIALSSMQRGWPMPAYLLCLVPHALGQGFQFPGTFMAILAASEQREQAAVTSTLILWRSVGMVLGIAGSSLVVQNSLWRYLDLYVTDEAARAAGFVGREEVVERVRESVEAVAKLGGMVREQVVESYEAAVRTTFLCCVGFAVVSFLVLLPVKLPRLGQRKK
ncbi:MFS general substrate transporter [Cryphonectria parasitica EP155]|uniref:MFS general substrate transporter n=1 Tax=Cryphonectria parasitica (strain ATCC 38755 / EP155) TaxID=660469 RepID=A0A9P5CK93_CRYP1|nr:MFS general substrate transporter [Cryphonectria parasitica EP155]KAF3760716.1 MFS general substrate transporter [Cryphonectria parasitica EP155]